MFFTENLKLNPAIYIDYHRTKIETLTVYENRLLITSSEDGTVSFTDVTQSRLEAAISASSKSTDPTLSTAYDKNRRKESIDEYNQKLNLSYLNKVKNNSIYRKKSIDKESTDEDQGSAC